ncbi:hypothetical protein E1189_03970 [Sansalvadorimonas verongulae]|nr:hypothetical protein [Sansalvadorimonas verongulae]
MVQRINKSTPSSRQEARQKALYTKAGTELIPPPIPRLDLMIYPLQFGRVGISNAINCGSESIIYLAAYAPENTESGPDAQAPAIRLQIVKQMIWNRANKREESKRLRLLKYLSQQVAHPNIAHIRDWREDEQQGYILMVESPACPVEVVAPWEEAEIRSFARQMLSAISALHMNNYVHRDFKPDNVLYRKSHDPKNPKHYLLTDMGQLRKVESDRMYMSLHAGTMAFLTPEHLRVIIDRHQTRHKETSDAFDPRFDIDINGYAHDLFGFAMALIQLSQGRHPVSMMGAHSREVPEENRLDHYQSQLQKLVDYAASENLDIFTSHLYSFIHKLMPKTQYPIQFPDWLTYLIRDIFKNMNTASDDTAQSLFLKHFAQHRQIASRAAVRPATFPRKVSSGRSQYHQSSRAPHITAHPAPGRKGNCMDVYSRPRSKN